MKKVLIFSALAGMVSFYACKKDDKTITVTENVHDTITNTVTIFPSGMINGDSLAQAITLVYGTKVADSTFPAASADADAPVLDTTFSRVYTVARTRYLTIYPPNVSGHVDGYYVQIVGAKSYFKLDYPEAEVRRAAARKANTTKDARGGGTGYIDSTLVFKLPASVRGDTFYVKYAAYDASNRVSKPVIATVVFLPENTATSDALTGDWKFLSYANYYNGEIQNDWKIDTGYTDLGYYTCNGTTLSGTDGETEYHLPYYIYSHRSGYQFGKSSMLSTYREYQQYLDLENSTCSKLVYSFGDDNYYYSELAGGYSYDAVSKKITFIFDNGSNLSLNYQSYYVSELTNSTLILSQRGGEDQNENYTSLAKFIKQ